MPAAEDAVDGYLPVRSLDTVVLVPVADVAPRQLQGVRWVAHRHRCAPFLHALAAERQARAERREHVDSLADVVAAFFASETRTDEQDPA